jgi:hypothetical protein
MAGQGRIFRLFVSSTFADMHAEREVLQRRVFPRLQRFCLDRGARFQAVDLRWGVSDEAALDQRTMPLCLDEIRRCQRTTPRQALAGMSRATRSARTIISPARSSSPARARPS